MAVYFTSPANNPACGYGRVATKLLEALKSSDIPITEKPQRSDVQIFYGQPFNDPDLLEMRQRQCDRFFIYTMFESSLLPDGWVEEINKHDALLTPSRWCGRWFQDCGVNVPWHLLHHGVDPAEFPLLERPVDRKYFTFIIQCVNPRDRKGCELVRRAFYKLRLPRTRLIVKAVPVQSPRLYMERPGEKEIWDWYSQKQMLALLQEADISLNPTSGEGFGCIPIEHAATGLAVAATDFSGCREYLNDLKPDMIGIKWRPKPSYFNSLGGDFGFDAAPDFDHLCSIMEYASKHRDEVRAIGQRLAQAVHERWTWQRPINQLREILKGYHAL
jgi:glycosyltransferase involved in cell wall biosynthesis